jgi:hypothetical protein
VKRLALVAAIGVLVVVAVAWFVLRGSTWTITLTQTQLEEALGKRFPMRKSVLMLLDLRYENPRVKLTEGSDEIGFGVDIGTNLSANGVELRGSADLVTKLAYDAERAAFVLHEPRLVDLRVTGLSDERAARVRDAANLLAREQVAGIPVYTLRRTDAKQALARLTLKSTTVRSGVLVIEVGI